MRDWLENGWKNGQMSKFCPAFVLILRWGIKQIQIGYFKDKIYSICGQMSKFCSNIYHNLKIGIEVTKIGHLINGQKLVNLRTKRATGGT